MNATSKGNTFRLYLDDEATKALRRLSESTEISQTEILSTVAQAGLRAIAADGDRVTFPLRFVVGNGDDRAPKTGLPRR